MKTVEVNEEKVLKAQFGIAAYIKGIGQELGLNDVEKHIALQNATAHQLNMNGAVVHAAALKVAFDKI